MDMVTPITLLISAQSLSLDAPKSICLDDASRWITQDSPVWQGDLPLGVFLTQQEPVSAGFTAFAQSQNLPVFHHTGKDTQAALDRFILDVILTQNAELTQAAMHDRVAAARLRQDYMQLQQGFAQAERFLFGAMAPDFSLARDWRFAGETLDRPVISQRLPIGSTGLAAIDIWCSTAGSFTMHLTRLNGPDFIDPVTVVADGEGWARVQLGTPLAGQAEDMMMTVHATQPLGLSHPSPIPEFAVEAGRPLALRLWKGLPGVQLPNIPADRGRSDTVEALPPSHMPTPELIGNGSVVALENRDALSLHTDFNGDLHLVFRDLDWPQAASFSIYVQNSGPKVAYISFAAAREHDPVFRPPLELFPTDYSQGDVDLTGGVFDLHVKIESQTPMTHIILWGFEWRPVA